MTFAYQNSRISTRSAARFNAPPTFVLFTILLVTAAFLAPFERSWTMSVDANYATVFTSIAESHDGGAQRAAAILVLGAFGLFFLLQAPKRAVRPHGALLPLCLGYLAWCGLSGLWADDPMRSFSRLAADLCAILAAYAIARWITPRQLVSIVGACAAAWMGVGVVAELAHGTLRPWESGYRFAGVLHPNEMGMVCALALFSALYLRQSTRQARWWLLAAVAVALMALTASRTALAASAVVLALAWLVSARPGHIVVGVLAAVSLGALAALLIVNEAVTLTPAAQTLRLEEGGSSLSGRAELWTELKAYMANRPIEGYGYKSFWTDERIVEEASAALSAHSLYIDLMLNVGLVGAALHVSAMLVAMVAALRLERQRQRCGYGFLGLLVAYLAVSGLTESTLGSTHILPFFMTAGICLLILAPEELAWSPRRSPQRRQSDELRAPLRWEASP